MKGIQYSFINVDESVIQLMDGFVYVCNKEKVAQLKCPCGCNDIIYLNLIPDENPQRTEPRWKIVGNTITPSINRTIGCRSHFQIINGIVIV